MTELKPSFWNNVWKEFPPGCWIWIGTLDKNGYGKWYRQRAHRQAYLALRGPIPEGLMLDHKCRNRACVNPDHLRPVTPRQNSLENSVGQSAIFAKATHCVKGHPFIGDNLYLRPRGGRRCKICNREAVRQYRAAHIDELRKKDLAYYYAHLDERRAQMRARYHAQKDG